ncbi:MAG: hypothetical protein ACC656_14265, partial [Candidatus Heimdallarchaeota archaeon]
IGKPLYFDQYHGMHHNKEVVKYVTDIVMREIRKLSAWYSVPNEDIVELYHYYDKLAEPVM